MVRMIVGGCDGKDDSGSVMVRESVMVRMIVQGCDGKDDSGRV